MAIPEKHEKALRAIQAIMLRARFLVYTQDDYKKIADILDYGEVLPILLCSTEDETDKFSNYLQSMRNKHSDCAYIYDEFIGNP